MNRYIEDRNPFAQAERGILPAVRGTNAGEVISPIKFMLYNPRKRAASDDNHLLLFRFEVLRDLRDNLCFGS
ncbi:MAG: hypothetical protein FWE76_06725 [Symbiobacteriaceae bacterium]|nr:hypothetical protein [Symbiobacteriaceae bacterium]